MRVFLAVSLIAMMLGWGSASLPRQAMARPVRPAADEAIYVALSTGDALPNARLYRVDPTNGSRTLIFDWSSQPVDTTGTISHLSATQDGFLLFDSDNADLYTPSTRNLYQIRVDGTDLRPLSRAAWGQSCAPCGTVTGVVRRSNGDPYSNAPVFLDGVGSTTSAADGSFRFDNVPSGSRWLIAYRPGDASVYDAIPVNVAPGSTVSHDLVPNSSGRMSFQLPQRYGSRLYYRFTSTQIQSAPLDFGSQTTVYDTTSGCSDVYRPVDGFHVAPQSGRLAIVDYQQGCGLGATEHVGIYVADGDGGNRELRLNMYQDQGWQDGGEIFWSPDERWLAWKAAYQDPNTFQVLIYLVVLDAATGQILGNVSFPPGMTMLSVSLHGWSPDGRWLLTSYGADPSQMLLVKVPVNQDGSLDANAAVTLLSNEPIAAAVWAPASTPAATPTPTPAATPTSTPAAPTVTPSPTPSATPLARIYLPQVSR